MKPEPAATTVTNLKAFRRKVSAAKSLLSRRGNEMYSARFDPEKWNVAVEKYAVQESIFRALVYQLREMEHR